MHYESRNEILEVSARGINKKRKDAGTLLKVLKWQDRVSSIRKLAVPNADCGMRSLESKTFEKKYLL